MMDRLDKIRALVDANVDVPKGLLRSAAREENVDVEMVLAADNPGVALIEAIDTPQEVQ